MLCQHLCIQKSEAGLERNISEVLPWAAANRGMLPLHVIISEPDQAWYRNSFHWEVDLTDIGCVVYGCKEEQCPYGHDIIRASGKRLAIESVK